MPQKRKILRLWRAWNWNGTGFEITSLCHRNDRSCNGTLSIPRAKTLSTRNWNGTRFEINSLCRRNARSCNGTPTLLNSKSLPTRNWNGTRFEVNSLCHRNERSCDCGMHGTETEPDLRWIRYVRETEDLATELSKFPAQKLCQHGTETEWDWRSIRYATEPQAAV